VLVALSMELCATWCMLGVTLQICLWRLPFQLTVTAGITNSADSCTNSTCSQNGAPALHPSKWSRGGGVISRSIQWWGCWSLGWVIVLFFSVFCR
jgi:hypothetical protein